ncbi:hypothetical protein C0991_008550 [Blastosporella zonata]|nr:hypothetical protein C0991_008550 [Blastosporella zonata]
MRVSQKRAGAGDVWNSGTVPWKKQRLITYTGPSLSPDTLYFWIVQIETSTESVSTSSEFTTGHPTSPHLAIQVRQNDPLAQAFVSAQWIWTAEADVPPMAPAGERAFRKTYTPPNGLSATSADILIAVDDRYSLYVSGQFTGSQASNNVTGWRTSGRYNVPLSPGSIVFAVLGANLKDIDTGGTTPAGLLAAIRITHSDGSVQSITSDTSWRATASIPVNFEQPALDDSSWQSPFALGKYGVEPWETQVIIAAAIPTLPTTSSSVPLSPPPTGSSITLVDPGAVTTTPTTTASLPSNPSITASAPNPAVTTTPTTTASLPSNPSITASAPNPPGTSQNNESFNSKTKSIGTIVGGVIGGVVILALLIFMLLYRKRLFPDRRDPRLSFSAPGFPSSQNEGRERLIQPFPSGDLGRGILPLPSSALEPVRKHANHQPSESRKLKPSKLASVQFPFIDVEYQQAFDIDAEGSVSPQRATGGASTMRLQRLQTLMVELNHENTTHGEGSPYVSELRGRIAELARDKPPGYSKIVPGHVVVIPPPYQ